LETDDDKPVVWWGAVGCSGSDHSASGTKYAYGLYDFDAGDFRASESGPSFDGGFDAGVSDHNNW
jgi:hypothetical protein